MNALEIIRATMKDINDKGNRSGLIGFVDKPRGNKQKSDIEGVEWEWVEQCSVGDNGDSYNGSVFIEVEPGCFAEFEYS